LTHPHEFLFIIGKKVTKILIVDDDKGATGLIEQIMLSEGFKPTSVNDSSKAMDIAIEIKPDLCIFDLMMPKPDGFQLCRMFRANPRFMFTPIIIVTALDDADSKVVAFGAGANDYLAKPFQVGELVEKIRELL
jgi:DNA-binding response OmpR family regulator